MGPDYSFYIISIATYAPQFNGHKKILGSVLSYVKVQKTNNLRLLSITEPNQDVFMDFLSILI